MFLFVVVSPRYLVVLNEFCAEFIGTFIILFVGNASGGAGQLGRISTTWEYGITWGLAVVAAILASGKS